MSLSIQKMVSDGTLSTIVLGVQYLQRNDMYMRIAGVETPQSGAPSGYTWSFLDNNTIRVLPVVPAGVEVVVYRRTDLDEMYNIYSQNAQFDESTIDENNQQLLYIAQEYFEQGVPAQLIDSVEYVREDTINMYYRLKLSDGKYTAEFPIPKGGAAGFEALRRTYLEAGLNLVEGSFETGGTLSSITDVLLHNVAAKAYAWSGAFPKVVSAGATPTPLGSGGWIDRSDVVLRGELASDGGSGLVGTSTGLTVQESINAITGRYDFSGKSLYDVLSDDERARLLSNDSTLDLTAKIQSLIDERKPFYLVPNVRHYCYSSLQMKSGAKILGAGEGTNQNQGNSWTVETAIVFNQATTDVGIQLSSATDWVTEWAIDGVTLDTINNTSALTSFKMLNVSAGHNGCYNFKLHCYIRGARYGAYIDSNFWNGDIDLRIAYCYMPFIKTSNGASTSLSGWIKCSFSFHGVDLTNVVYSPLNFWFDKCGLLSAPASSAPSNELPIMLKTHSCVAMTGTIGVEESKAQLINAQGYSAISYSTHYFTGPTYSFYKDPVRIANVPLSQQGVVFSWNSSVVLRDIQFSRGTAAGYPAASTTDPTYFFVTLGSDNPVIDICGSFMDSEDYCAHPAGTEQYVNLRNDKNRFVRFAATNLSAPRVSLDYRTDLLRLGTDTARGGHQIKVRRTFVEGDMALEVGGATGSANVIFNAVNGAGGSTAIAAMRVPAATSTSRSINAGGTVNASGADYAEYIAKSPECGEIKKGDICGITINGELTDKYDESISFVIKSTNPAYVGGDNWFTEESPEQDIDESVDEFEKRLSDYTTRMEVARQTVDRIAFCGQVPCNVLGAKPGDYVVPVLSEQGGISYKLTSSPSLDEYMKAVGHVWKVMSDGRAWVSVKIA